MGDIEEFAKTHFPDAWEDYERELHRYARGERIDRPKLMLKERAVIEKFDGEYEPGKKPVETVELE